MNLTHQTKGYIMAKSSIVYKAQQVLGCTKEPPKPWEMEDERKKGVMRSGVTHKAFLACYGILGDVQNIMIKAKTAEELTAKVARFTVGKPAEIPVIALPVFKGDYKVPSSYEMEAIFRD
jgi:hypothetical protein